MNKFDDRIIAILAVTIICIIAMFVVPNEAKEVMIPTITGIFGIVTGRAMKNKQDNSS